MAVIIGTSGWQYRDWRGRFYPQKLPQRLWLEHYAEFFATVESNNAFYRLPELETFRKWHERTPPDFRWAVKASRFLTHIKRLREPAEPVARLMGRTAKTISLHTLRRPGAANEEEAPRLKLAAVDGRRVA